VSSFWQEFMGIAKENWQKWRNNAMLFCGFLQDPTAYFPAERGQDFLLSTIGRGLGSDPGNCSIIHCFCRNCARFQALEGPFRPPKDSLQAKSEN
jgi:hypothetical protein